MEKKCKLSWNGYKVGPTLGGKIRPAADCFYYQSLLLFCSLHAWTSLLFSTLIEHARSSVFFLHYFSSISGFFLSQLNVKFLKAIEKNKALQIIFIASKQNITSCIWYSLKKKMNFELFSTISIAALSIYMLSYNGDGSRDIYWQRRQLLLNFINAKLI